MNVNIRIPRWLLAICFVSIGALIGTACSDGGQDDQGAQDNSQRITETYYQRLQEAVPYPLAEMRDSLELRNIRERLLRFNDPNKIGYVYHYTETGQLIGFYTMKGKVTSTGSQMTTTDLISDDLCGSSCTEHVVISAPGDDGSYGPNECESNGGAYFFTTENVMVTMCGGIWVYLDAPIDLNVEPLMVYDAATAEPSSVAPACDECVAVEGEG